MPKFTFGISREYTIVEGFDRTYEADTIEEALAMAEAEADGWATTTFAVVSVNARDLATYPSAAT